MNLQNIRLSNFQSFGPDPVSFAVPKLCYLIGPNGSGKTAALQAICRLFAFDPALRRIKKSDFHVPHNEAEAPAERKLWIEWILCSRNWRATAMAMALRRISATCGLTRRMDLCGYASA